MLLKHRIMPASLKINTLWFRKMKKYIRIPETTKKQYFTIVIIIIVVTVIVVVIAVVIIVVAAFTNY